MKTYQITFLPWISFNKEYKIGPILFWPYYLMKNHKIIDKEVIIHLDIAGPHVYGLPFGLTQIPTTLRKHGKS